MNPFIHNTDTFSTSDRAFFFTLSESLGVTEDVEFTKLWHLQGRKHLMKAVETVTWNKKCSFANLRIE